jgi:hypothetical protein
MTRDWIPTEDEDRLQRIAMGDDWEEKSRIAKHYADKTCPECWRRWNPDDGAPCKGCGYPVNWPTYPAR